MRGIQGGQRRQHLTVWHVAPIVARAIRSAIDKYDVNDIVRQYGVEIERLILESAQVAPADWCDVREDRPEIVTRRDNGSPMAWFAGRTVSVWGCGALGGHVAEYIARAGVKKLVLKDNGTVTPGVLVPPDCSTTPISAVRRSRRLGTGYGASAPRLKWKPQPRIS